MKKLIVVFAASLFVASFALPAAAAKKQKYPLEGVVTQWNMGDGSFALRLRNGDAITIENPFQVGAFLGVNADLVKTATGTAVINLSHIAFLDPNGPDAIPAITALTPGAGSVGDRLTISGGPFTRTDNDVAFSGPVSGAIKNMPSFDGKTLYVIIPSKLCFSYQKIKCTESVKITQGEYVVSVTNANGLSNSTKFNVRDLPPLTIATDRLAQAYQGARYSMPLEVTGGAESYVWKIAGSLPNGLGLVVPKCVAYPCRVSATVSGIPTTPGTYGLTLTLTSGDETVSRDFSITVVQAVNDVYRSATGQ